MSQNHNKIPSWMSSMVHDPAMIFQGLGTKDQEMLQLLQLMLIDVQKSHSDDVKILQAQLKTISTTQENLDGFLNILTILIAAGATQLYLISKEVKSEFAEISANLAAHSGEIVADLIQAVMYETLGSGKPFKYKPEWLEKKKADVKDKSVKAETTHI